MRGRLCCIGACTYIRHLHTAQLRQPNTLSGNVRNVSILISTYKSHYILEHSGTAAADEERSLNKRLVLVLHVHESTCTTNKRNRPQLRLPTHRQQPQTALLTNTNKGTEWCTLLLGKHGINDKEVLLASHTAPIKPQVVRRVMMMMGGYRHMGGCLSPPTLTLTTPTFGATNPATEGSPRPTAAITGHVLILFARC